MNIICVAGTRPEVIKLAPVVHALAHAGADASLLLTGQHQHMAAEAAACFDLQSGVDLGLMTVNQTPHELMGRILLSLGSRWREQRPDVVIVQGDTTSALSAALVAFHMRIPLGHVEAGLRTGDLAAPFPEEFNRRGITLAATWHFAPTPRAHEALCREGVPASSVHLTGNTIVDAVKLMEARGTLHALPPELREAGLPGTTLQGRRLALVTLHRRENHGAPMHAVIDGIAALARANPDVAFCYPVHPHPESRAAAGRLAGVPGIFLLNPLPYGSFLSLLRNAALVITDSGGVQEEATVLGRPTLVARAVTERPEGVEAGITRLVGFDTDTVVREGQRLLDEPSSGTGGSAVFGDGNASARIAAIVCDRDNPEWGKCSTW